MNFSMNISANGTLPTLSSTQIDVFTTAAAVLLFSQVYLLIAFTFFAVKRSKQTRRTNHRNHAAITRKKLMFGLLVFATAVAFLRSLLKQQDLFIPSDYTASSLHCALNLNIFHVLFASGFTALYFCLWLRQHTLYSLPSMKGVVSMCMIGFSYCLLALIALVGVGAAVGLVLANPSTSIDYVEETRVCAFPPNDQFNLNFIAFASYGLLVFYQVSLLFCFLHILRRHQHRVLPLQSTSSRMSSSSRSMHRLMKRCTIAAFVAVVTDITSIAIMSILDTTTYQLYLLIILEIDYCINLGCVIFCFSTWKKLLNPWSWSKLKKCLSLHSTNKETPSSAIQKHGASNVSVYVIKSKVNPTKGQTEQSVLTNSVLPR